MKTQTLVDRIYAREAKSVNGVPLSHHIRAELQRVARQVRKLDDSDGGKHKQTIHFTCGYYQAIHDVKELIRKATR